MVKKTLFLFCFFMFCLCNKTYCETGNPDHDVTKGSAPADSEDIGVTSPIHFPSVTKVVQSTGIVIVILLVTVYVLRRKLGIKTSMNKKRHYLLVVDTVSLGAKKHVHMIKIPGKLLLIGVTNERIQTLSEITEKEIVDAVSTDQQTGEFMNFFKRAYKDQT